MKTAAGYIRVSTSGQLDNTSLEDQAEQITEYCSRNNLELILPLYDEGWQSGADNDRPKFQQMLADADQKKFEVVVIWALDRFGREMADMLVNARRLERLGIELISVKEKFGNDPQGKMMRNTLANFAEYEKALIKDRTHRGRNKKWKNKEAWIGQPPFGYRFDEKICKVVQILEEAKVVRRIVELYLNNVNYSFNDICLILKRDHTTTKRGKEWTTANLSATLSKTIYYGYHVSNTKIMNAKGEIIGDKPPEDHIIWDANDIDAIMTKQEWDDIQAKAKSGKSKRAGRHFSYAKTFMLHDLLKCGLCGSVITPYRADEGHNNRRYYKCRWHKAGAKEREINDRERCLLPTIPAEQLEDWIWDQLAVKFGYEKEKHLGPLLQNDRFDEQIAEREVKIANIKKLLVQKERAIKRLDEQILMADDDYNPTEFRFKRREFSNDINHHKKELEAAKTRLKELQDYKADQKKFEELVGNEALLSAIWLKMDDLELAGKQRLLQGLLDGPLVLYPRANLEQIKRLKMKMVGPPIDPVKSKPKFRYNEAVLHEVLGLEQYLEKC
jgi:site-specific DNA recombinase